MMVLFLFIREGGGVWADDGDYMTLHDYQSDWLNEANPIEILEVVYTDSFEEVEDKLYAYRKMYGHNPDYRAQE